MRTKHLIQALTGTQNIVVDNVCTDVTANAIYIIAHPRSVCQGRCGICGKKSVLYDRGRGVRKWRCLDIGGTKTYVVAESPRVCCKEHGVVTAQVPWARHKSRFCKNFEDTVVWMSMHNSKKQIAELMRIEWHTVLDICHRVYQEFEANAPSRFDNLVNIGIDETSYKKGHKYMTVVVNHDTGAIVWCAIGYGKDVLEQFFRKLTDAQKASIKAVTADGAKWIADCVSSYCPNAVRCIDPFHVVSWATEALDSVRRRVWSEATAQAKELQKPTKGYMKKDDPKKVAKEQANKIKGTRYALLKNPDWLTNNQQKQLEFLATANPKLYKAYLLKENLRLALKASPTEILSVLNKWMSWAQRCRIPGFRELRKKIKRHLAAIIATVNLHLSNARVEAINNKIKLIIRTAYGFRNPEHLLSFVMLSCSNFKPFLPGRATHSN